MWPDGEDAYPLMADAAARGFIGHNSYGLLAVDPLAPAHDGIKEKRIGEGLAAGDEVHLSVMCCCLD
jgi:hypothetical protein